MCEWIKICCFGRFIDFTVSNNLHFKKAPSDFQGLISGFINSQNFSLYVSPPNKTMKLFLGFLDKVFRMYI